MNTFLVDGNFYLHRAYSVVGAKDPKDSVARLFLSIMAKDAMVTKGRRLFVGFDGEAVFRYKLYPEYKSNRSDGKGEKTDNLIYKVSLPHLQTILTDLGIPWEQKPEYEADDLLASTCQLDGQFTIGTRDKDMFQVLDDHVDIFVGTKPQHFIRVEDCVKKFGLPPNRMVMFQSLIGDAIDNIPQIMKPAQARKLCLSYNSLADVKDDQLKVFLLQNKARIQRNRKLVKLVTTVPGTPGQVRSDAHKKWSKVPSAFVTYCEFVNPKTKRLF